MVIARIPCKYRKDKCDSIDNQLQIERYFK